MLSPFDSEINNLKKGEKIYADIEQFLTLVRDADFVLTDSFHGVAFSVNFRKKPCAHKIAPFAQVLQPNILQDFLCNIGFIC